MGGGPGPAAAVVVGHDVGGQQLLEVGEPALPDGLQQPLQQFGVVGLIGLGAPPALTQP
jgi:hypothetical protein